MKKPHLIPLAVGLWLCLGVLTWAQVTVSGAQFPMLGIDGACGSAPTYSFQSDSDTGLYWVSSGVLGICNNGSARFSFTSGAVANTASVGGQWSINSDTIIARNGSTGSFAFSGGTTPTQSGTTCGTTPTITGNNTKGCITLGASPGLPCQIVFNGTETAAPAVFLNPEVLTTATTTVRATSILTTGFVITSTAALVATDKVCWWAPGP